MDKQTKAAQKIAGQAVRQQMQKVERSELGDTIAQIATSLDKGLGTYTVRKVLACKILSSANELSVTEWCAEANVGRNSWYRIHLQSGFGEVCVSVAKTIFGPRAIEVTQALIRKALHGSQDGLGDVTAQTKILQQVEIVDKEDSGYRNYSDDELRRIAREALGIIADESGEGDREQPRITEAS